MSKRAFLVGCNYTAMPSIQLSGCINDIVNVRNTLIDAYGYSDANIYTLRDDDNARMPNKANIMRTLSQFVSISKPTDTLWFHYSGHGTRIRDTNGDEVDGSDECIVPCDYNAAGVITDDELFGIIRNAKCRMIICLDSCHSGSGCDLQYAVNYSNGRLIRSIIPKTRSIANANIIMLSGCRDEQTSADAYDTVSKRGVGAFTHTLLETLRLNDHNIDILPLYTRLCANLRMSGFTQIPVLSSSSSSVAFRFARTNGSSSVVNSISTAKDLGIYNMRFLTTSNNVLQRRMSELYQVGH
jgi:hypothetical protein